MRVIVLFFFIVSSCLIAQNNNFVLPVSAGEWHVRDSAEVYAGDELYKLIDGGAEIFKEYGFNKVIVQSYSDKAGNSIDVEVYQMKDSSSSYGIFSLNTYSTGKPVDFPGDASAGDEFLIFRKGNYYFSLTALSSTDAARTGLFVIARQIDTLIAFSGKPSLVSKLEKFSTSRPVYFKGSLGFYNLSTINTGDEFKIEEGIFLNPGLAVKHFALFYSSPDESRKNYLTLVKSIKGSSKYKILDSNDRESSFLDQNICINYLCSGNFIIISISEDTSEMKKAAKKLINVLIAD